MPHVLLLAHPARSNLSFHQSSGTTLHSLGYTSIGIDEGWEGWYNESAHETHDPNGIPQVNTDRFPDMPALVKYGHSKGVEMGFYLNGCGANELGAGEIAAGERGAGERDGTG